MVVGKIMVVTASTSQHVSTLCPVAAKIVVDNLMFDDARDNNLCLPTGACSSPPGSLHSFDVAQKTGAPATWRQIAVAVFQAALTKAT